jgi:hypothetical protein
MLRNLVEARYLPMHSSLLLYVTDQPSLYAAGWRGSWWTRRRRKQAPVRSSGSMCSCPSHKQHNLELAQHMTGLQ